MKKFTRPARGVAIAVFLALVAAAPAAADPPTRVVRSLHPFTLDAGTACTFEVNGEPSWGFSAKTTFSDGRVQYSVRAHGAYVNPLNDATFETADNFRDVDTTDPATGYITSVATGQASYFFLPGDQGPFGQLGSDPGFWHIDGRTVATWDPVTGHTYSFSWTGTATDICAALA